jgi:hypothetical protein
MRLVSSVASGVSARQGTSWALHIRFGELPISHAPSSVCLPLAWLSFEDMPGILAAVDLLYLVGILRLMMGSGAGDLLHEDTKKSCLLHKKQAGLLLVQ